MTTEKASSKFRALLLDIAEHLNDENLGKLKFLCKADIPDGVLSKIARPHELFDELIKREKLKKNDTSYLVERLKEIHRQDLIKKVQNFVEENLTCADEFTGSSRGQAHGLPLKMTTFIGRDALVTKIRDIFIIDHKQMVVLVAPPGFGKSSVAIHVGHSMNDQGVSVIFVSLRQITSSFCMCSAILKTLDPDSSLNDDVIQQAKNQLLLLKHPTVLVLDNTEDIQNSKSSHDFQSFIEFLGSNAKNLKIFLGTRKSIHTISFEAESINLPPLDKEASTKLLLDLAKGGSLKADDAKELGIQCAGVPLFIKIAAGLVRNGCKPTKLASNLQKTPYDVLKLKGNKLLDYLTSSIRVFLDSLSRDQLVSLVELSSFPAEFSEDIAAEIFFEKSMECSGMLSSLHDNALLQLDGEKYSLHPLIQTFCREEQERMKSNKEGSKAMKKFTYHYFKVLEALHRQFVSKDCQIALQHFYCFKMDIQQAVENALKGDKEMKVRCIDAFNSSINLLGKIMQPSHCLEIYKQLYDEADKMNDKKRMSECLVSLGFRHMCEVNHGKFSQEAFEAFETALSLWKRTIFKTRKHVHTEAYAHCLSKLGLCYIAKGDRQKGKKLINDAIQIRHQLGDQVLLAASFCDKAIAARLCGEHGQAITLLMEQCLPVYKEYLGDHPWVATLLNYISDSHQVLGCLEKAIDYNKQSLHIREKLLGDHQDTARSYVRLGELFLEQENMKEALGAFRKALAIQEKVLGIHDDTTATCQAVEDILFKLKMDEERQEIRERADNYRTELQKRKTLHKQISEDIKKRADSRSFSPLPTLNVRTCLVVLVALIGIFIGSAFVLLRK